MDTTTRLQGLLLRLNDGHETACNPLLEHGLERIRLLAHRMFRSELKLRTLHETDDVVQKAMIRLHKALEQVKPVDVAAFLGLAARQIRWVLLDLAQEADRPLPQSLENSGPLATDWRLLSKEGSPEQLLEWSEFHAAVDSLPAEEKEMFDLLLYQGLNQPEAAALTGRSLRTIKRIWQRARLSLDQKLKGNWPSLEEEP